MPVPDFQALLLPALKALSDTAETPVSTVRERVAATLGLKSEDLRELLPSGKQPVFTNRVSWTVISLERAGLLERIHRGVYRLTVEGQRLLSRNPSRIDRDLLRTYSSYTEWERRTRPNPPDKCEKDKLTETPEETLARVTEQLDRVLEANLLQRVLDSAPTFLERVVRDLLVKMGYGGGDPAMGRVTGSSGDGGIDATIREDALGLDEVYVQAKRYADGNTVSEGALRNFAGAIDAAGTNKGVFVTTASFSRSAREYVARSPKRIVLIDGQELSRLMRLHGIGVRVTDRHEVKRIDEDYFESSW